MPQLQRIVKDGQLIEEALAGEEIQIILDETPFYAESGGQIADQGTLVSEGLKVSIKDVQKAPNGQNLHRAVVEKGTLKAEASVLASVNEQIRSKIIKNHTATHLP